MGISRDEVRHVARLARLALTEEEEDLMTDQLGSILELAAKLDELDTADVEPTYHVVEMSNVLRNDESRPSPPLDEVLKNAPQRQDPFFLVPRILD